ncbi:alpha/beta hydrolase [Gordonia rhizosphera]|uniref:DUF1023 domain-containing protein n=1 Tax=Gordonia rhizosphera NBRC 16068 TaxID=1108045 RepID=K6WB47_9ACTN|nr:alpha/beta hydrolase [Gordonia rhizosphera]GAB90986.1 hypothetical protein GORHZ_120_00420 [Gordonia rhizosphera NBRC 16068]
MTLPAMTLPFDVPTHPEPTAPVHGNTEDVERVIGGLVGAASVVADQQDFLTGTATSAIGEHGAIWSGGAAAAYLTATAGVIARDATARLGLVKAARAFAAYADRLAGLQSSQRELSDRRVGLDRAVTDLEREMADLAPGALPDGRLATWRDRADELAALVAEYTADNLRLRKAAAANENALVTALDRYGGVDRTGESPPRSGDAVATPVRTGPATIGPHHGGEDQQERSPAERARWWAGLTASQQSAMMRDFPERLGNGPGLPARVRDDANRRVLRRDLAESRAILDSTGEPALRRAAMQRWRNATSVQDALHRATRDAPGVTVQLYGYDPAAFGGDGKSVIAIGDLDRARHVAWNVPGMTTDISGSADAAGTAATLFRAADGAHRDLAAVAWIGYDAPSGADLGAVTAAGAARDGGAYLADDLEGFAAARAASGTGQGTGESDHLDLHVIGHSYGATTLGWAGDSGRLAEEVDSVTLLGAPGAGGAASAAEFGIGPEHVYVGAASDDPVAKLGGLDGRPWTGVGGLGADPAATHFGGERFRAEFGSSGPFGSHTAYFKPGTESLDNLAKIVVGRGDEITHENRKSAFDVLTGLDPARRRDD